MNSYKLQNEEDINVLTIDNTKVRESQIKKIAQLKQTRNEAEVQKYLSQITECCRTGAGNLLDLGVQAARARATVGEITSAMEIVFKRHVAKDNLVSGAYKTEFGVEDELTHVNR